jgi:hypothetical protein
LILDAYRPNEGFVTIAMARVVHPLITDAPRCADRCRVIEKLDFLVRFWELRARYEAVGGPLTERERVELLSRAQLVGADATGANLLAEASARQRLPVQMTAPGGFLSGEMRSVAAEQLVVAAARCLPEHERTIVYVADAVSGVEYALPCVVLWCQEDEPCLMGLGVDGIPTRSAFTIPVAGMWRSPLRFGQPDRVEA